MCASYYRAAMLTWTDSIPPARSRWARVSGISPCAPRSPTEEEYWRAAPSACIENRNGLRHLRCSTTWLHRGPDRRISEVVARNDHEKDQYDLLKSAPR